jgi:hypothetical protein
MKSNTPRLSKSRFCSQRPVLAPKVDFLKQVPHYDIGWMRKLWVVGLVATLIAGASVGCVLLNSGLGMDSSSFSAENFSENTPENIPTLPTVPTTTTSLALGIVIFVVILVPLFSVTFIVIMRKRIANGLKVASNEIRAKKFRSKRLVTWVLVTLLIYNVVTFVFAYLYTTGFSVDGWACYGVGENTLYTFGTEQGELAQEIKLRKFSQNYCVRV